MRWNNRFGRIACALPLILLSLDSGALDSAGKKPITVDAFYELRTVGDPQISPDGKRIIYTLTTPDRVADKRHTNLWIVASDGSDNRPLTTGAYSDSSPRWSPDGTRIAYLSDRSGSSQIHVRWMDTGQETTITSGTPGPAGIAWSPDGQSLAFTRRVPRKGGFEIQLPAKPANAKWGEAPIVVTDLKWQMDGQGLIKQGSTQVFVVPATGGTPRQITTGEFDHGAPKWTRDGGAILSAVNRSSDGDYSLEGSDIYSYSVSDGSMKQLTTRKGPDQNPEPSPDGKLIAYTGADFTGKSYEVPKLYVMDSDGSHSRCLTDKLDRDIGEIEWAPDSRSIVAAVSDQGSIHLRRIELSGRVGDLSTGPLVAGLFTISHNGRIAATRMRPTEPADLYTLTVNKPEWKQLTHANEGLLAQTRFSDAEEIWYDSFDGKKIQGWIIKPPDFDASKKYPLLLYIHGGPHAMYNVTFAAEFQMHAANGYVVLYTNPRGSTGYGHAFGVSIWHHYPEDDFRDLMAGVDAVIAKGYIDPKKLAMTGGSGGGCLTSWGIGHTDRFAVAAAQFPVTDWINMVGTADFGYFFGKIWMDGMPWENPKFYLERSPIFYAKNFKTPTLIITGEEDHRTPIAQSEELFLALKSQKVDAMLIRMPQEPHGAGSNYISHQAAKVLYLMKWFDKYIKPGQNL